MIPEQMKEMFGLKDGKDLKMANNIWKMLDQMSSEDPEAYKKFINKNISEGLNDAKSEKQRRQKPFKIIPHEYILLQMQAKLEEKVMGPADQSPIQDKLDINIDKKQKWSDVQAKFPYTINISLSLCHSERVKKPEAKGGKQIKDFQVPMIKEIESLYYSLQGPEVEKQNYFYCMIFNTEFINAFERAPNGRRILMGLAISYFQQRIMRDRNFIMEKVNTISLYGKNLYYGIDKLSIEVSTEAKFLFGKNKSACPFLLELEVDNDPNRQASTGKIRAKPESKQLAQIPQEKSEILIRPKQQEKQSQGQNSLLLGTQANVGKPTNKKVLIEVLEQKQCSEESNTTIPYEMKESDKGYSFEFLVHGVTSIADLDLQVSSQMIRLGTLKGETKRNVEIKLAKPVNQEAVRARMKKKSHLLLVDLTFSS